MNGSRRNDRIKHSRYLPVQLGSIRDDLVVLQALVDDQALLDALSTLVSSIDVAVPLIQAQYAVDRHDQATDARLQYAAQQRPDESDEAWKRRMILWGLDGD